MEKHCESSRRFEKEGNGTAASEANQQKTAAPRKYYIPEFSVRLIREGTTKAETKTADSPARVAEIIRAYWGEGELDREHLVCLMLNARSQVVGINTVSVGTLTASLVHPREVFRPALLAGTVAGIVVVHNHPSGDRTPSNDDKETTRRLVKAGEIMGIPVLDHVIMTGESFFSFREHGMMR